MNALDSLKFFLPESILLAGAFLVLVVDFFSKNSPEGRPSAGNQVFVLALATLVIAGFFASAPSEAHPLFFGFFTLDRFTHFFRYGALGIVAVSLLAGYTYPPLQEKMRGEFTSLFLFMAFGLILMASSTNLLMIFLAIEFVSLLSYLLVGFIKKDGRSKEAALKYFLFGSICSGLMLYGMSLLFGATGSLEISAIGAKITQAGFEPIGMIGFLLLITGIGFKISMAPFHLWAPDVYEGAPTPVTAFLTVGPKALGFAVLLRVLAIAFSSFKPHWSVTITILSIVTMTLGNVIAVAQTNIKRLLAYSSIAQAGYILMGVAVFSGTGITAVLIYLVAYTLTNLGVFLVVIAVSNYLESDDLSAYAGLSKRSPFLAAAMTVFLLSLAGLPPLAGFIGKFYVFAAALEAGFVNLAIAAALNSAVAAYYYFKIVRMMYLVPSPSEASLPSSKVLNFTVALLLIAITAIGIFPSPLIALTKSISIF
ncbi:MAG: NADH-quinone oxidoreductase subunit N [Candidatus Omnitrophica bacterium]|nr:NADH-quinone oxidoreductase subunit N [Candidatus Omnitrophota bacterium]